MGAAFYKGHGAFPDHLKSFKHVRANTRTHKSPPHQPWPHDLWWCIDNMPVSCQFNVSKYYVPSSRTSFFFFKLKKSGSLSHSKEGRKGKINSFFILFFSFSCLFLNRRVTSLWLLLSNSPGMRRSGLTWRLTRPGGRGCVCLRSVELRADPSPEATATNPLAHVESLVRTVRSSWEGVLVLTASSSLLESTGQSTDIHYFVLSPPRGCEFRTAFSISEMRKLTCRG